MKREGLFLMRGYEGEPHRLGVNELNRDQKISYYRGRISNREHHIKNLEKLIWDMEYEVKGYTRKIKEIEHTQVGGE